MYSSPVIALLFWLGVVFGFFHVMPAFLTGMVRAPLTSGDLLDFLTPFAVIPVAWMLYRRLTSAPREKPSSREFWRTLGHILAGVGIILYIDGHGLHLSANAIARLLDPDRNPFLYSATYLFDEIISHFMWDGGVFLMALALIVASRKQRARALNTVDAILLGVGALSFGFTFTVNGIEGQTVMFTFPAAGLAFALALYLLRRSMKGKALSPVPLFFAVAYGTSLILFAVWGILHRGFPQFSELGWI